MYKSSGMKSKDSAARSSNGKTKETIWAAMQVLRFWYPCSGCALLLHAHGQVDEGEDVVLDHDGEAEEHGVEDQDVDAQLHVQPPLIQVDPQDLHA